MEIRMDRTMLDMNDKEILEQIPTGEKNLMGQDIMKDGPVVTLKTVAINALVAIFQDEANISGEEKVKRWELAIRIKKGPDSMEMTAEEVSLVKKLIAKMYGPLISGQAWAYLETKQ